MSILPAGRWARRSSLLLSLFLVCSAGALAAAHLGAWYHYRAAQTALSRYHFAQARGHLAVPLRVWPDSWQVHLLAARAARLDGAVEEAREHLLFCQHTQPKAEDVLLEWALLRAQVGELAAVEDYLRDQLRHGSALAPLIEEALIEGYIRTYRIGPALAGVQGWLKQQPDDTQALYLLGCLWQQVQRLQKALPAYRRAVELDPQREDARWHLCQCLLRLGLHEEANPHLEYLHRLYPQNAEITVALASARFKQGWTTEARRLLDAVLAEQATNEPALRERGRLALAYGKAEEAEKWLRQAAQLNPHDAQLLPLLSNALEHQGKHNEAQSFQDQLKQNDHAFHRLEQICLRELGERPQDPLLHAELGTLLLRLGHPEAGRNWLLLALQEDPTCAAARAALAGDADTMLPTAAKQH
jgi:tetratricopeptide (TPR) repeat protein